MTTLENERKCSSSMVVEGGGDGAVTVVILIGSGSWLSYQPQLLWSLVSSLASLAAATFVFEGGGRWQTMVVVVAR
jgi:hypothetical protein